MKKVFVFLSICILSLTGLFFACNDDKYADLNIGVGAVSLTSGERLSLKKSGNLEYYEVNYGDTFSIEGIVTCSNDMSKTLIFDSINDSISKLPSQTETNSGSVAVFKANQPSYGNNYFRIKISSVETPRKAAFVNVKVALPVRAINLQSGMAITSDNDIKLSDYVSYTSAHPDSGFMTTQKDVTFDVLSFKYDNVTYTLNNGEVDKRLFVTVENGITIYSIKDSASNRDIKIFSMDNGKISVINSNYTGTIQVEATSSEFNENKHEIYVLKQKDVLSEEEYSKINKANYTDTELGDNERLKSTEEISITKNIGYQDFSFAGGQIGYEPAELKAKLNSSLYINTLSQYVSNGINNYYFYEQIDFSLNTTTTVDVYVEELDFDDDGIKLDNNGRPVVKSTSTGIITSTIVMDYNNGEKSYEGNIKFNVTEKTGVAYYDIVFVYSEFSNKPTFRFYDLYQAFLRAVESEEGSDVEGEYQALCFDTSAIASSVAIYKNDSSINEEETNIDIYDGYANSFNGGYGTKIAINLTMAQNVSFSRIKSENQKVRISLSDRESGDISIPNYIEIRNFNGNFITLQKDGTKYYFELNLATSYANYFYLKAKENSASAEFNFYIENVLESSIQPYKLQSGEEGVIFKPETDAKRNLQITTHRGVNTIKLFTKDKLGNYEEIDLTNLTENVLYQTAVLKLLSADSNFAQGALIGIVVNKYTTDRLTITAEDSSVVNVFDNLDNTYNSNFDGLVESSGWDSNLVVLRTISVSAIQLGETTINFVANNGVKESIKVKVVNSLIDDLSKSFNFTLKQNFGNNVVTYSNLINTSLPDNEEVIANIHPDAKISTKVGGTFSLSYNCNPDATSLIRTVYVVKNSAGEVVTNGVKINAKTGVVSTSLVGTYYVFAEFYYYGFETLTDNEFICWNEQKVVRAFKLEVYEPATSIKLNKYVFNVYDSNSLGYEYKENSIVSINVIIGPVNASILSLPDVTQFSLGSNNGYLSGSNGVYTARLGENQTRATEYIYVKVLEYGTEYTLVCTVNITKPVQVKEINATIFDGDVEKITNVLSVDAETIKVTTKNARTLTVNTTIAPNPNLVFVDDLVAKIYRAKSDLTINLNNPQTFSDNFLASLSNNVVSKDLDAQELIVDGQDSFSININNSTSGYFYLIIFARDSMTSANAGKVYKKILIEITDGTQQHPYNVENIADLIAISDDATKHYVLGTDINLNSIANWNPLAQEGFTGSLNGYNADAGKFFKISGLKISNIASENVGLFAKLSTRTDGVNYYYGAILNLSLIVDNITFVNKNVNLEGVSEINIGCLVGLIKGGLIMNCAVTANNINVYIPNKHVNIGGAVGQSATESFGNEGGITHYERSAIYNFPNITAPNGGDLLHSKNYVLHYDINTNEDSIATTKSANKGGKVSNISSINKNFISTNPYNITMSVSDNVALVNAGGIVGKLESGEINGLYGVYDHIDKVNLSGDEVTYLTSYQSQGFDVNVYINNDVSNPNRGKIVNINSAIGGVIGYAKSAGVYNISSSGKIGDYQVNDGKVQVAGALTNVGGSIGYETHSTKIKNVLASVKLRGVSNVGGAIGFANSAELELARVENYEDVNSSNEDIALIIIGESIDVSLDSLGDSIVYLYGGGVIGFSSGGNDTKCSLLYCSSFVNYFNPFYIKYGDIYSNHNKANLGGVFGFCVPNPNGVERVFAKVNIVAENNGIAGGLVASVEPSIGLVTINDAYYIGVINSSNINKYTLTSDERTAFGSGVVPAKYYYYYAFEYVDTNEDEQEDALKIVKTDSSEIGEIEPTKWSASRIEIPYLDTDDSYIETSGRVLSYRYDFSASAYDYFDFVKFVPNSIQIETKDVVDEFNNSNQITYSNLKYFTKFDGGEDGIYLIAKYTNKNNKYDLNDLFKIIPNPNVFGRLNIVVTYSLNGAKTNLISIDNEGRLTLKGLATECPIEINFYVRENILAKGTIYMYIVENFDEFILSTMPTGNDNLLNYSNEVTAFNIRKNTESNIFEILGEYVNNYYVNDVIYTSKDGTNSLIKISNITNYTFEYTVIKDGEEATEEDFVRNGYGITFLTEGIYEVRVEIKFTLGDTTFTLKHDDWHVFYNIFSGAIDINFNTDEIWLASNKKYSDLVITLKSDVNVPNPELNLFLTDANQNTYKAKYIVDENRIDADFISTDYDICFVDTRNVSNVSYVMLKIDSVFAQNDIYNYSLYISVDENKKSSITQPVEYTLWVADAANVLDPISVKIVIVPQAVTGISAIHYRYTQAVSKLVNTANTNELNENTNYAYNFTNEPKNSVVAGNDGLFVIDVYPYYSNITSVSIESSLSPLSGNALQFVQLVRVKSNRGSNYSYIYAPTAVSTGNRGIYLGLYSDAYIDDVNMARISYDENGKISSSNVDQITKYVFTPLSDGSEMGRLYVKTIAPTNLREEEQFNIQIKINFIALNEDGDYVEQQFVYNHTLVVESVSGYVLTTVHDGYERNKIAVTDNLYSGTDSGADWLDLGLSIDETFTSGKININYQTKEGEDKENNSDYASLLYVNNKTRLILGSKAEPGDIIEIHVVLEVEYDNYIEQRVFTHYIYVVDLIIDSIEISGAQQDYLIITVSTSKQLRVVINGYGTAEVMYEAENMISRMVDATYAQPYYWFASVAGSNKYYVALDSSDIKNMLPFSVNKVAVSNTPYHLELKNELVYDALQKVIIVEGSTFAGSVDMLLNFSYLYRDESNTPPEAKEDWGKITFVPNNYNGATNVTKYFTIVVREDNNEDHPVPIYTAEQLREKLDSATTGNYILMNDIEIDNHIALNAKFTSFDGNNKVITINSFAYSTNLASSNTSYSIEMGLFNTIEQGTIVKNVIVALPTRISNSAIDLTKYSIVKFGGIAAVNRGIITNCDVISSSKTAVDTEFYARGSNLNYTLNIETTDSINGIDTSVNIGLFVAENEDTGVITNSRVGREKVDILTVYDSQATVVYKSEYDKIVPITLVKVYGRANVSGFVAQNNGTISSSFAANLQIENISKSATSFVKTAGFVVQNNGYVYGCYASGWEEDELATLENRSNVSVNRKLGGGLFSNGAIAGFVYNNAKYIEDCYANINCSGDLGPLFFAAASSYEKALELSGADNWSAPAAAGFVYISKEGSYITTSYSLSKIESITNSSRPNTFGAFEGRMASPDAEFDNSGEIENCYFMLEKGENFSYEHERAVKLTNDPAISLEGEQEIVGINEFVNKSCFNNFSFDNSFDAKNSFSNYANISTGGVWAIYSKNGVNGYPDLISANTIAISCRVLNVTKTEESQQTGANTYYYTFADGYEIGSHLNPYIVSNFAQYNNIFKDTIGAQTFNDEVTTKFVGNIRLINHINLEGNQGEYSPIVYSSNVEYTSNIGITSIFDGNYLSIYNMSLSDQNNGRSSFGLFKDIYYASVKNITLVVDSVNAGNTVAVGVLAGTIVNGNISNVTLISTQNGRGIVIGNNYVGALAGIILSSQDGNLYTVTNIKSNLSVVGSVSPSSGLDTASAGTNAITTSGIIWERIKPIANASGLSALSSNLRLHKLPLNVYYAGGIVGVIDLSQKNDINEIFELTDINIANMHVGEIQENSNLDANYVSYTNTVKVLSDYAGGLFGFVGSQTYVDKVNFIASLANEDHYISGQEIAGGIVAVNFGKISQSYVSFNESVINQLDEEIREYVDQGEDTALHINSTLFSLGNAKYVGGIAGINVGNGKRGSGTIEHCYNRVDVKNVNAIGVGGIVGGSHIGEISNVYSTASVMGKLFNDNLTLNTDLKIGAIVGKIFENSNEGYFADYNLQSGGVDNILSIYHVVAMNFWDSRDFDSLHSFVVNGGKIGSIYGYYENDSSHESHYIKIGAKVFIQNYILQDYTDPYISTVDVENDFHIDQLNPDTYIELWGSGKDSSQQNSYNTYLYDNVVSVSNAIITPNKFRAFFSYTEAGLSGLRDEYFPPLEWPRTIWSYPDKIALPILEYGYESSVVRIYTAAQFIDKLNMGNTAGKLYVIMNDIDFNGYVFGNGEDASKRYVDIKTAFRGQLYGNNVTYVSNTGVTFTRKPILFNIEIRGNVTGNYSGIFANSIGATFANLNIVVKNYEVSFEDSDTETVASVLVANSVNTNINNVHIYSSLTSYISKELFDSEHEFANDTIKNQPVRVVYGYSTNSDTKVNKYQAYLKLATPYSFDERNASEFGASDQWYYLYDEGATNLHLSKFRIGANTFDSSLETAFESHKSEIGLNSISYSNISTINIVVCSNSDGIVHNDFVIQNIRTVGLITGVGSLPYISNCSVMIDVYATYKVNTSLIYVGLVSGRMVGQLESVVVSTKFKVLPTSSVSISEPSTEVGVNELCIGSVVGQIRGSALACYLTNSIINIGELNNPLFARSGNEGLCIGGMFGYVSKYSTMNDSVVGGVTNIYSMSNNFEAHVAGTSNVAGIIGQNDYNVSNIFDVQSDKVFNNKLKVCSYGSTTSLTVGGIIAEDNHARIQDVYSNTNIDIILYGCSILNVGGIVGVASSEISIENAVYDAEYINIDGDPAKTNDQKNLCVEQNVGGILGTIASRADIALVYALSSADITSIQAKKMYIGGAIGNAPRKVSLYRGIVLGNITLQNRRYFEGNTFVNEDQYIGGLVGKCEELTQIESDTPTIVIVLSTIRDYSIAQKSAKLNIGPVVGTNKSAVRGRLNIYYNENISLTSDNGYGSLLIHLDQTSTDLYDRFFEAFNSIEHCLVNNNCSNIFTNYLQLNYADLETNKFRTGSKLNPIVYNGSLSANKYYILTQDKQISGSISASEENWVLNAQGYLFYTHTETGDKHVYRGSYPIFNAIPNGGAVVGLIEDVNVSGLSQNAIIAKTNNGFLYACGVAGTISGNRITSLVYENLGVISTSFSNANQNASNSGAGIVMTNGNSNIRGNIYNCFYTGILTPTSSGTFTGLCSMTGDGAISNCYSMADIDITNQTATIYPISFFENSSPNNLYKCFYDYVAYTGTKEGKSIVEAESLEFKTNCGIYVWTSSLSGASSGRSVVVDTSVSRTLEGNWSEPGNVSQLVNLFKKTDEYISKLNTASAYTDSNIKLDTSWFNFGYLTIDYKNVLVNPTTEPDDTDDNIMRYLTLIYSGNGLANKDKQVWSISTDTLVDSVPGIINAFENAPYQVKHAGLVDILVNANNLQSGIAYKYYLVVKNINFQKYTIGTYWSKTWDENKIAFLGDFDGNSKTIKNMYSSFGLLRAIADGSSVPKSHVHNICFSDCYSKTGIVAGGMKNGQIHSIEIGACVAYNGNINNCVNAGKVKMFKGIAVEFDDLETDYFKARNYNLLEYNSGANIARLADGTFNFAGIVVGYMDGGTIDRTCTFSSANYVVSGNTSYDIPDAVLDVYIGGVVGYLMRGTIGDSSAAVWNIGNLGVYAIGTSYGEGSRTITAGGVAGYVGGTGSDDSAHGLVSNISIQATIGATNNIGGVVGILGNYGQVDSVSFCGTTAINLATHAVGTESGAFKISASYVNLEPEVYVGGVVAKLIKTSPEAADPQITNSSLKSNFNLQYSKDDTTNNLYFGGIVGGLIKGLVSNCKLDSDGKIVAPTKITNSIAGGIVGLMRDGNIESCKTDKAKNSVSSKFLAGGIVGKLENGIVGADGKANTNGGDVVTTTGEDGISGGIIGMITCQNSHICTVQYNTNSASIQGKKTGGIVGYVYKDSGSVTLAHCTNASGANVGSSDTIISGGIVSFVYMSAGDNLQIDKCSNAGRVSASQAAENNFIGGIIGVGTGVTIISANNIDDNSGTIDGGYVAGGVAGYLINSILDGNFVNKGNVKGKIVSAGVIAIAQSVSIDDGLKNEATITNYGVTDGDASYGGISAGIFAIANGIQTRITGENVETLNNTGTIGGDKTFIAGGVVGYLRALNNNDDVVTKWVNGNSVTAKGIKKSISGYNVTCVGSSIIAKVEKQTGGSTMLVDTTEVAAGGIIGFVACGLKAYDISTTTNGKVLSSSYAGGIIGYINSTVVLTKVTNATAVEGQISGGLIALMSGSVTLITEPEKDEEGHDINVFGMTFGDVKNTGKITGKIVGGIAGSMNGGKFAGVKDKEISNTGEISVTINEGVAGGLIGEFKNGVLEFAKNSGDVKDTSSTPSDKFTYIGGLVGNMTEGVTTIRNSCTVIGGKIEGKAVTYAGGLVGIWSTGTIEDVNVTNINITNGKYSGGLIGYQTATSNLMGSVTGKVTATEFAGGAIGHLNSTSGTVIVDASGVTEVNAGSSDDTNAGGVVGKMDNGTIGFIEGLELVTKGGTVKAGYNRGGLVGYMAGGDITSGVGGTITTGAYNAGGVVGLLDDGRISSVTAQAINGGTNAGGLVGYMRGGSVNGGIAGTVAANVSNETCAGGVVGRMEGGTITEGVVGGKVTAGYYCGGLVGYLMSSGKVTGGTGGQVGDNGEPSGASACGGVVGYMKSGDILGSATRGGTVKGGKDCGGIVGKMDGGTISGGAGGAGVIGSNNTGGIVGVLSSSATISAGRGASAVNGGSSGNAGGVVGYMNSGTLHGTISPSSAVSGGNAGGIVGKATGGAIISVNPYGTVSGGNAGGVIGYAAGNVTIGTTFVGVTVANGIIGAMAGGAKVVIGNNIDVSSATSYAITATIPSEAVVGNTSLKTITSNKVFVGTNNGGIAYLQTHENSTNNSLSADYNGTIANNNTGTIYGCVNNYSMNAGGSKFGGIVGSNSGIIYACNNIGSITATSECGGIACTNSGKIFKCNNSGEITSSGNCGGIVAGSSGEIADCNNTASIEGNGSSVGGIAATNSGTISGSSAYQCKNSGTITGGAGYMGGICGYGENTSKIVYCENSASIDSLKSSSAYAGGIAGRNAGTVYDCYNSGNISVVNGSSDLLKVAGEGSPFPTTIFNTGTPSSFTGGIVGYTTGGASGYNEGTISGHQKNNFLVSAGSSTTTITDYRGQIAGVKTSDAVVKNLGGHTPLTNVSEGSSGQSNVRTDVAAINIRFYQNNTYQTMASVTSANDLSTSSYLYTLSGATKYSYTDRDSGYDQTIMNLTSYWSAGVPSDKVTSAMISAMKQSVFDLCRNALSNDVYEAEVAATNLLGLNTISKTSYARATLTTVNAQNDFRTALLEIGEAANNHFEITGIKWIQVFYYSNWRDDGILDTDCSASTATTYGISVAYNVKTYTISYNSSQQWAQPIALQDCGGYVSVNNSGTEGQTEYGYQIEALKELYDKCGPCDEVSAVTASPVSYSSINCPSSGGSVASPGGNYYGGGSGGGSGGNPNDIIEAAYAELQKEIDFPNSTLGGQTYWSFMGWGYRVEWCCCFVAYCANQCGYLDGTVFPKKGGSDGAHLSSCWGFTRGANGFQSMGVYYTTPKINGAYDIFSIDVDGEKIRPGDILFFDWIKTDDNGVTHPRDGSEDHIGIVVEVDGSNIITIEGNCSDKVGKFNNNVGSYRYESIMGFARPHYPEIETGEGALSDITLTGVYAERAEKINSVHGKSLGKSIALTGLQIKQAGTGFQYSYQAIVPGTTHYNYYSTTSMGTDIKDGVHYYLEGSKVVWYVPDVIHQIKTGGRWYTDCCGFVRLCQAINGKNGAADPYNGLPGHAVPPNQLQPGDFTWYNQNGDAHILIVLYVEGNTLYMVDESGLRQGTINDDNSVTIISGGTSRKYVNFYHWPDE